ncbi:hypothetical protein N7G274_002167 [Stereocaulon virgatum]|uniref:Uncharacterized protein n=1 Tax=Stereocaulon virgatum TaxID=373712 RepID=A0ABR4ALP7_9LECA
MSNYRHIRKLNGADNYSEWEVAVSYIVLTEDSSTIKTPGAGGLYRHDYAKYVAVNQKASFPTLGSLGRS